MQMKRLIMMAVLVAGFTVAADGDVASGGKAGKKLSCEERRKKDNTKAAEKYRKRATAYSNTTLSKRYDKASEELRNVAEKEVSLKKKVGEILNKIADAYENNEQETLKTLHKEKWEVERSMDIAHKKTKMMHYTANVDKMIEKYPDSASLKELKGKLGQLTDKYINIATEINDKMREQMKIDNEMREMRTSVYKAAHEEKKKLSKNKAGKK
jgi:hypothetical protein